MKKFSESAIPECAGAHVLRSRRRVGLAALTLAMTILPLPADAANLEQVFDQLLGTQSHTGTLHTGAETADGEGQNSPSEPSRQSVPQTHYSNSQLDAQVAQLAEPRHGRIGVAAVDLNTSRNVVVLADQPFPLASTGKVAIVATFLDDVDAGRLHLDGTYPMMIPLPSRRLSSLEVPERSGRLLTGRELIELAITRSDNRAADALLAAVGGPASVDRWLQKAGISGMHLDRRIGTLVRDDGVIDPATTIDQRDSTTPQAMVELLGGLWEGEWLSPASRDVLLGAMGRCRTGIHRMRAGLPGEALLGHKTGTLHNTSSDVGFIRTPDGHTLAIALYVTGQVSKPAREARIATIARAIYNGETAGDLRGLHSASR